LDALTQNNPANLIPVGEIEPDTLSSLQDILGPNATFKASEQFQAYWLLKSQAKHILHVAPTGFGKMLPVQLAAFNLQHGSVIVTILPYKILYAQTSRSMTEQGVGYVCWSCGGLIPEHVQVVGAPLESLCELAFQTTIRNLSDCNGLFAIVIDEASGFMEDSDWHKAYQEGKVQQHLQERKDCHWRKTFNISRSWWCWGYFEKKGHQWHQTSSYI
jgi:superfamily II DNA helicase RecQ